MEKQTLAVIIALRQELGREPTHVEVAQRLGLRNAKASLATVRELALPFRLTERQEQCLRAIATLEARLGRNPSTREVSDEMGLAASGSRFHIKSLVKLGLVNPPAVQIVRLLSLTDAGRAYLPTAPPSPAP